MTTTIEASERNLVTIETIRSVSPIVGADAIEQVTVRGWTVVTKKGEFQEGDTCLYFEIDSALPVDDQRFAFLASRGEKTLGDGTRVHVLKTARLRGVYSQGLALPYADFPEIEATFTDFAARMSSLDDEETHIVDMMAEVSGVERLPDVAALLGVTKYEPPLPTGSMNVAGVFPTKFGRKTDSERTQNLTDVWPELVAAGPWLATEKVDGSSLSVFSDFDGNIRVCSRNWELTPPLDSETPDMYWRATLDAGLHLLLQPGEGIQAEIVGPDIQGNPLGLNERKVVVFAYLINGVSQPREFWPISDNAAVRYAPIYDLEFPATAAEAVEQVDGIKSLVSPGRNAEGIVWHRVSGEGLNALQGRSNFKTLSNRYIVKHDN